MTPTPEESLSDRISIWVSEAWTLLTAPSTLLGLLAGAAVALGASFWVSHGGSETWREFSGVDNPLLARIDSLLGLHAPWEAWWAVVVGVAAVVSVTAFLVERSPWWSLRPRGRDDLARRGPSTLSHRKVRAATACLGDEVKLAEGGTSLALLAPAPLYRPALVVLFAGALVLSFGIVSASQGTILGELVLSSEQSTSQVFTPGRLGQPVSRKLPFSLSADTIAPSGERASVVLQRDGVDSAPIEVTPNAPLRTGTTWILPRHTRRTDGGERFRLRLRAEGTDPQEVLLVPRESASLEGNPSGYRVRDYVEDLNGAGPAVWVERLEKDEVQEGFWVFQKVPEFDADNRDDPVALELLGIERQHQLVAGVVHLSGLLPLGGGFGLFLLGLVILAVATRRSRIVGFDAEGAWGYPAKDPSIGRALDALTDGSEQ